MRFANQRLEVCHNGSWTPLAQTVDAGESTDAPNIGTDGPSSKLDTIPSEGVALCGVGEPGPGGITISCGPPYQLVVTPGGCGSPATDPGCDGGPDDLQLAWGGASKLRDVRSPQDGAQNSVDLMVYVQREGVAVHPAVEYCMGLVYGGYADWYLPAVSELRLMLPSIEGQGPKDLAYWSSTEQTIAHAWTVKPTTLDSVIGTKHDLRPVRCMRRHDWPLPAPSVSLPNPGLGYFVLLTSGHNGFLSLGAAQSACLDELKATQWKGKADAEARGLLTSDHVRAFLCAEITTSCHSPLPSTRYAFARANQPTIGGAIFHTDGYGRGPGDKTNWAGLGHFGGAVEYWTHRGTESDQLWAITGSDSRCAGSQWGVLGSSNNADGSRFSGRAAQCSEPHPLICIVDP